MNSGQKKLITLLVVFMFLVSIPVAHGFSFEIQNEMKDYTDEEIMQAVKQLNEYVEQNRDRTFYFKYDVETLSKMLELDLELIKKLQKAMDESNNFILINKNNVNLEVMSPAKNVGARGTFWDLIWVSPYQPGDVTMTGSVTVEDANKVLRYIVGLEDLTEAERVLANYNLDGQITVADASGILHKITHSVDRTVTSWWAGNFNYMNNDQTNDLVDTVAGGATIADLIGIYFYASPYSPAFSIASMLIDLGAIGIDNLNNGMGIIARYGIIANTKLWSQ